MAKLIKKIYEHGDCTLDVTNLRKRKFPICNSNNDVVAVLQINGDHFSLKHRNHFLIPRDNHQVTHDELLSAFEIARECSQDNSRTINDISMNDHEVSEFFLIDEGYLASREDYAHMIEAGFSPRITAYSSFPYHSTADLRDYISAPAPRYRIVPHGGDPAPDVTCVSLRVKKPDDYKNSTVISDGNDLEINLTLNRAVIESFDNIVLPEIVINDDGKDRGYNLELSVSPVNYKLSFENNNSNIDLSGLSKKIKKIEFSGQNFDNSNTALLRVMLTVPDDVQVTIKNVFYAFSCNNDEGVRLVPPLGKASDMLTNLIAQPAIRGKDIRKFYQDIIKLGNDK